MVFLKKLHTLTLRSFLPPFFATLFISVFLLFLAQIVITYLDDFIGKGLKTIDLMRLFAYAWIAIIPQCIPLAVLLASIMSFGNMAENYELAAMKSSGLSLFKIVKAVFVLVLILAGLTFLFNNFVLPIVHLKSTTLLYDIRQKKPAVNIKEGIFYNAIDNYSLRVGKKSPKKDVLYDLYIYDHSSHLGNTVQMYSESGKITTTADTSALVLILRDGNRYEEGTSINSSSKHTFSQLNYKQLQVNIPLEDFKMKRTSEELFKGHGEMLNVWQIDSVIDSTKRILNRRFDNLKSQSLISFYSRTSALQNKKDSFPNVNVLAFYDSLKYDQFNMAIQNALNISRTAAGNIDNYSLGLENEDRQLKQYLMEWHKKIVVCFACIILFFIGAPLGAIIKKGGLGLPVIVSVIFFLAYYILTEMFNSLAIDSILPPWQALWAPLLIFLPISVFLTIKAANDSVIFDATIYYTWAGKLFRKKERV
ncbi:LptF/LptG family permease [Aurantibacillus circumpalustris]|uniref:LptF/LptG family permease n=1 Tax=Aurantibacillus circumpalustris TaxID=3036359 RepID=UPI00295B2642|nr:LptF/LptG family permease [Aurantibacillus circumpalustris]